ncbi:MAG TPA: hypothetical protein VF989_19310, partial [Polyangiaceae bacterium]
MTRVRGARADTQETREIAGVRKARAPEVFGGERHEQRRAEPSVEAGQKIRGGVLAVRKAATDELAERGVEASATLAELEVRRQREGRARPI